MKKISSKSIFASLIFLITISFIINNFLNDNNSFKENVKNKNNSKKQEKILGVQIRQQNQEGVQFLIVADTLEEVGSKENGHSRKSATTINQNGILTKISAGKAIIKNNTKTFLLDVSKLQKNQESLLLSQNITGTFEKGNYHTDDDVMIAPKTPLLEART